MGSSVIIRSSAVSTDTTLPPLRRDPVWDTAGSGGRFGFDLSFPWSYAGGTPANGQIIRDTSEFGNGGLTIPTGASLAYVGGGLDFTGLTDEGAVVAGAAGCLSSIHAGPQYFLAMGWWKAPTAGNWNTSAGIAPIFCSSAPGGNYTNAADLLTVGQHSAMRLYFRRQTVIGTAVDLSVNDLTNFYGRVCQWAYWRTAAGTGAQLRSSAGVASLSGSVGAANAANFSATLPRWGVPASFNNIPSDAAHLAAASARLYRGHIEDLAVSGRDPLTVVEADWSFVTGLARYS